MSNLDQQATELTGIEVINLEQEKQKREAPVIVKNQAVGKDSKYHTGTSYNGPKKPKAEHKIKGKLHTLDKPMTRAALKRKLAEEAQAPLYISGMEA